MIQATSAPLENAHPSPHSTCVATSSGKPVTRPVNSMPAPMNRCAITSDHFRLSVSAQTPAGTSPRSSVIPTTVPRTISSDGERSATRTKYRLELST